MNIKHIVAVGALSVTMGITGCAGFAQNDNYTENIGANARAAESASYRAKASRHVNGNISRNLNTTPRRSTATNNGILSKSLTGYADSAVSTNLNRTAINSNVADSGLVNQNIYGTPKSTISNKVNTQSANGTFFNNPITNKTSGIVNTPRFTTDASSGVKSAANSVTNSVGNAVNNTISKANNAFGDTSKDRVYSSNTIANNLIAADTEADNGIVRKNYVSQKDYQNGIEKIKTESQQNEDIVPTFSSGAIQLAEATDQKSSLTEINEDKNSLDGTAARQTRNNPQNAADQSINSSNAADKTNIRNNADNMNNTDNANNDASSAQDNQNQDQAQEETNQSSRRSGGTGGTLSSSYSSPDTFGLPSGASVYDLDQARKQNRYGLDDISAYPGVVGGRLTNKSL